MTEIETRGVPPHTYRPVTIFDGVRTSAGRTPNKVAVTETGRSLTYSQLIGRADRVTAAIKGLGLKPGDHAAMMLPNCLEFIEILGGLVGAGVPPAMISPRSTTAELSYICDDSEAQVLFVHESLEDRAHEATLDTVKRIITVGRDYEDWVGQAQAAPPETRSAEWDVFALHYTAGTTGRPKGGLVPHRSRVLTMFGMASEYACFGPDDRGLAATPLYHGGGLVFALAPIFFGGSLEILPKFDPDRMLALIEDEAITNTMVVPTHFHSIFELSEKERARHDTSSLRSIVTGGAPLLQPMTERVVAYFGDHVLHELYGSTEGGIFTNLRPADQLRKERCVGLPFPCTEVRLLDRNGGDVVPGEVGEFFSRSPYHFNGYWRRPEASAEIMRGEWLSVGEMAQQDEEGYVYLVDRKKDLILSGGENIYPQEVESVLNTHPAVVESAVIGVPDERWGEVVCACIVKKQGMKLDKTDLINHCSKSLSRSKIPKSVVFLDALPRDGGMGKVLRRALREELSG